jgi:hypothetical protein
MDARKRTRSGDGDNPAVQGDPSALTGRELLIARLGGYGGAELVANLFGGAQQAQHEAQGAVSTGHEFTDPVRIKQRGWSGAVAWMSWWRP